MPVTQAYQFTPCCGGPSILFRFDSSLPSPGTNSYQYIGTSLFFGLGGVLIPDACYTIQIINYTGFFPLDSPPPVGDVFFVGKGCGNINPGIVCSPCTYFYQVTNCADENEVYCTTSNFSAYINNQIEDPNLWPVIHLVQFPNKCFYVEQVISCTSPINLTADPSVPRVFGCVECQEKLVQYYELVNCNNTDITIYTSSDLSEYIGSIITLNEYPDDCWYIEVLTTTTPSDITVTPNLSFNNCEECSAQQYLLQDCNIDDPEPNIITNTDLSAYVGQVVTLINCPDKCWIVSEADSIETPQSVHVIANHTSCETCAVPPTPVVPDPPVYKSITPGYNTPGCTPEKFERIVCNFSEAMYRQIMVDAYGITPCCGEDDIQYEISYELIMLKAIQDPDYTCGQIINCDCTTSTAGLSQPNCTPPN